MVRNHGMVNRKGLKASSGHFDYEYHEAFVAANDRGRSVPCKESGPIQVIFELTSFGRTAYTICGQRVTVRLSRHG